MVAIDEMDAFNSRACDRICAFISRCESSRQKTDPSNKPIYVYFSACIRRVVRNALYDDHIHLWYIIYSISLWGALLLLVEYMNQKWLSFRRLSEGKPTALIRNGIIDYEALKKNRMTLNQLQSLLRQSETFSLREVAYVI
jgi:uncharacterized membrane protein YcaP (DUF421 family)